MKIVFLEESTITIDDIDFSCYEALGEYVSYPISRTEEETIERSAGAPIVIANKAPMTERVMTSLPDLRLVAVIATGYNNVDIPAARARNIRVCNVGGYAINTVPQHTFTLILNLVTHTPQYMADVKAGDWASSDDFGLLRYRGFELAGKTIGIIGMGTIGGGVARIAEGFGMHVLAYDMFDISHTGYPCTELTSLLRESDIVTVHCPLTDQTRDLIGAAEIAAMKKTALVINTARGGIINEPALADALNDDRLGGAGFDVLTKEPPRDGNPLLTAKNTLVTPHTAWSAVEARQKLVDETAKNIQAFIEGRERNVVSS